ncbi:MAG TPA: ATP-binding protein [Myxococcota bacterium]|nr:ATP-binding protein [Myxococcota bacterium]
MAAARRALGWVELVDRWVPAALHRDPIVRRRARVIVFNVVVLVSYSLARIGLELALEPFASAWRTILPLGFGSAAGLGITAWLWRRGDTERAAQVGMWLVVGVAVLFTLAKGGMRSPGLFWFAVVPVLARACAGSRTVIATTAGVAAFLVACSMLDFLGIELSGAPTGTQLAVERLVALLAATVLCGGLVYMHGVFEEEAQRALVAARDAATSASRAKSLFVANVSHEIRTPMTAILGYTDVLAEPELSETERREAIETLRRNGHHLLALINDMLDLSKIEAGGLEVRRGETSPISVSQHVVALLRERARTKGLLLELELAAELPDRIWSDALRLQQILVNLVGNAIKFTEQGGVRLLVSHRPVSGGAGEICFDVIDSGIGIAPADRERVFAPFSQADASESRRYGGTGLGLAISLGLAQQLGGKLELESELGRGSTFRLRLPVGAADGSPRPGAELHDSELVLRESTPNAAPTTLRGRVLVAEDGVDNQRLIQRLLSRVGLELEFASDGRSAIDQALAAEREGRPFGAVLMDMQMPEIDGYAATQALRDAGFTRPIIALSAHAMIEDRERCLACGCNAFAAKPFDRRALVELLAEHLSK